MNDHVTYPYTDEQNNWLYLNVNTIIINDPVKMRWNARNKKYYIDMGYECVNWKEPFYVDIQDLSKGSDKVVIGICQVCDNQREVLFKNLIKCKHSNCQNCSKYSIDLTGNIYERFTVLWQLNSINKSSVWWCRCECGTEKSVSGANLRNGTTLSCGCLGKELASERMSKRIGDKNPNWNPDKTDEERNRERSSKDDEWAYKVKEKDKFTCQCCGDDRGGNLVSHHLNGYKDFPDQRLNLNNGTTLCNSCHKEFHVWAGGYHKTTTREDFDNFCEEIYTDALFLRTKCK